MLHSGQMAPKNGNYHVNVYCVALKIDSVWAGLSTGIFMTFITTVQWKNYGNLSVWSNLLLQILGASRHASLVGIEPHVNKVRQN